MLYNVKLGVRLGLALELELGLALGLELELELGLKPLRLNLTECNLKTLLSFFRTCCPTKNVAPC